MTGPPLAGDISPAGPEDVEAVARLVNSAYRGPGSRVGWTTEADYLDGQRTSPDDLRADLAGPPPATLLVFREAGPGRPICGCVLVARAARPDGGVTGYIGMVTVRPDLQASGLGRRLLAAAEAHALGFGADRARMTVVSIRDTLIAWYRRRGYTATGEREPFPNDARFGVPRRSDLEFVVLEKPLSPPAPAVT